jgi:hypothetical protein
MVDLSRSSLMRAFLAMITVVLLTKASLKTGLDETTISRAKCLDQEDCIKEPESTKETVEVYVNASII